MKKILGIVGSLRKAGNSELMIKQVCRELEEPHELHLLRLPEFRLKYCNGCYRCLFSDQGCVIKDDLEMVLDAIASADALILAMPTYFLGAHASLKTFLDRGLSFYSRYQELWGKPAIGLGVAGLEGLEGSTMLDIERFFMTLLAENKKNEMVYGAFPGEALLNEDSKAAARRLAQALFAPKSAANGLHCPCCGGETFRFYPDSKVRCMLCSGSGSLVIENGQPCIAITQSDHPFMCSEQDGLHHRDFLRGMVYQFRQQKKILAEVRTEFDDEVLWVNAKGTPSDGDS